MKKCKRRKKQTQTNMIKSCKVGNVITLHPVGVQIRLEWMHQWSVVGASTNQESGISTQLVHAVVVDCAHLLQTQLRLTRTTSFRTQGRVPLVP